MLRLVLLALVATAAFGSTIPPTGPPASGGPPAGVGPDADTTVGMDMDTTEEPTPGSAVEGSTTAAAGGVVTAEETTTTAAPVTTTTEEPLCQPSLNQIEAVFAYTKAPEFKDLSENQQILVYELLAAGEACKLRQFITVDTTQRIMLLLEDLPMRYIYLFTNFVTKNLELEGVVVPV